VGHAEKWALHHTRRILSFGGAGRADFVAISISAKKLNYFLRIPLDLEEVSHLVELHLSP